MSQTLLALYGLKWNPFSADLPIAAVSVPPKVEDFCWRIEHALIREGGFALIQGDPGTGKSVISALAGGAPVPVAGSDRRRHPSPAEQSRGLLPGTGRYLCRLPQTQ